MTTTPSVTVSTHATQEPQKAKEDEQFRATIKFSAIGAAFFFVNQILSRLSLEIALHKAQADGFWLGMQAGLARNSAEIVAKSKEIDRLKEDPFHATWVILKRAISLPFELVSALIARPTAKIKNVTTVSSDYQKIFESCFNKDFQNPEVKSSLQKTVPDLKGLPISFSESPFPEPAVNQKSKQETASRFFDPIRNIKKYFSTPEKYADFNNPEADCYLEDLKPDLGQGLSLNELVELSIESTPFVPSDFTNPEVGEIRKSALEQLTSYLDRNTGITLLGRSVKNKELVAFAVVASVVTYFSVAYFNSKRKEKVSQ